MQPRSSFLRKGPYETGAEKVNLIAHSKGGIEKHSLWFHGWVWPIKTASLTTLATPTGHLSMDKMKNVPGGL